MLIFFGVKGCEKSKVSMVKVVTTIVAFERDIKFNLIVILFKQKRVKCNCLGIGIICVDDGTRYS